MRILGLDVGTKTIGVAVSDPLGLTAQGVETIRRKSLAADLDALARLAEQYEAEEILIGLPLNMNGSEGPSVEMARSFGAAVAERLPLLPIIYRDERGSTVAATRILLEGDISRGKRKKVIDKLAAVYVLQGYLDYLRNQAAKT
ncbi:MAG: Holliday junction resolvase RuvX [Clostridia bacterium]|nr:Holliday junction resolvase RuvX [Clostridia bacterium]